MPNKEKNIALVGRPNVGKSRLFNRILGRRVSIVHDKPGVTRDIVIERLGDNLFLMDTGGIGATGDVAETVIAEATTAQANFAIMAADEIIFVVDSQEGLTPLDEEIAASLRKSGKPVIVAVNKIDLPKHSARAGEFFKLGFKDLVEVSAEHGYGAENLISLIERDFGSIESSPEIEDSSRIKICVAGRPNVGKSSICNSLLGQERLIVSDVAGTTRDCVACDIDAELKKGETVKFRLFDTAGVRLRRKTNTSLDFLSTQRAKRAMNSSDVVFLVLDAMEGVSELDKKLSGEILEAGASIVVAVNKWDYAVETFRKDGLSGYKNLSEFGKKFEEAVREHFHFLKDSPIYFVSAKSGVGVEKLLKAAYRIHAKMNLNAGTSKLNACLAKLVKENPPPYISGKRFKIYYAVKTASRPYTLRIYCNTTGALSQTYRRYIENGVRERFGLGGVALKIEAVGKPQQSAEERIGAKKDSKSKKVLKKTFSEKSQEKPAPKKRKKETSKQKTKRISEKRRSAKRDARQNAKRNKARR